MSLFKNVVELLLYIFLGNLITGHEVSLYIFF